MKGKFSLNYKLAASGQNPNDESKSGPAATDSGRPRTQKDHYLHDHRTKDALQEYRESLPD